MKRQASLELAAGIPPTVRHDPVAGCEVCTACGRAVILHYVHPRYDLREYHRDDVPGRRYADEPEVV